MKTYDTQASHRPPEHPTLWRVRRARAEESDAIARLYRRTAEAERDFLYPHTPAEDAVHFRRSFDRGAVWFVVEAGEILGFCAARYSVDVEAFR